MVKWDLSKKSKVSSTLENPLYNASLGKFYMHFQLKKRYKKIEIYGYTQNIFALVLKSVYFLMRRQ